MTLPSLSFGGLATPFDVNGLIDQIMAAESIPLQNLQATRQSYEAKDSAWSTIVTKIAALRTAHDALDFTDFMKAGSSDENVATATVTGSPTPNALTFSVDRLATGHQLVSSGAFTASTDLVGAGDFTVTVDGTDYIFTADATTTLQDLADGINGLGAGVSATALETDTDQYELLLSSQTTGDASQFTVTTAIASLGAFSTVQTGLDSQITMGSLTIERSTNSISDLIAGVTIDLKSVSTGNVTVTAERDLELAGSGVGDLVAKLNDALNELASLTSYNAESETAAILAGDSTARTLTAALRSAVSAAVGAAPSTYVGPAVGISITRTGTFEFDQEKFEETLAADFDGVVAFFEDVVLVDLDTELDLAEGIDGSIARARDRWQNQIDYVDDRIADLEDRLDIKEAALIRQFSALDVALQTLNTQSAWLSQQVSAFDSGS